MKKEVIFACLDKLSLTCQSGPVEQLSLLFKKLPIGAILFISVSCAAGRPETSDLLRASSGGALVEASKFLDKHKWGDAISAYRAILKEDAHSIPAIIGIATAFTYSGKREEALLVLGEAINSSQGTQRETLVRRIKVLSCLFITNKTFQIYQDGLNLMLTTKYRSAREKFEKALSDEPNNVEILTRLGQSLVLDESYGEAIDRLSLAKKLNPFEPEIRLWLGRANFLKGSSTVAISELKAAYQGIENSEQATSWLAEVLFSSGQINSAFRVLNNDVKKWPFHILSLLTSAKLRLKVENPDDQMMWSARKDLQLALSRLDTYFQSEHLSKNLSLSMDLRKSKEDTKVEIQKLLNQVQNKLSASPQEAGTHSSRK